MARVSPSLFKKTYAKTPKAISITVDALCKRICPGQSPRFINVRPDRDSVKNGCFPNVLSKVRRDGGSILYGWKISEWADMYAEAEHHAIWQNGNEEVDVTPNVTNERRILFLPDPERVYDFETGRRLLNIHQSSGRFVSIQTFLDVMEKWQKYREDHSDRTRIYISQDAAIAMSQEQQYAFAKVFLDLKIAMRPAEKCFCGSGMSFVRCCSPKIDLT